MGTRGVLAVAKGDSWEGVYFGGGAYPSWSGTLLWQVFHKQCDGEKDVFEQKVLREHPGGYYSVDDQCYCHDGQTETAAWVPITPEDEAQEALWLEWVYVIGRHALTIFASVRAAGMYTRTPDDGHSWQTPNYRWQFVTQVDLQSEEPNWQAIEAIGNTLQKEAERLYGA